MSGDILEVSRHGDDTASRYDLVLPAGIRQIELTVASLDFSDAGEIHYRHRIEGLDREWVDAGQSRTILYTGLRAGEHLITVE